MVSTVYGGEYKLGGVRCDSVCGLCSGGAYEGGLEDEDDGVY